MATSSTMRVHPAVRVCAIRCSINARPMPCPRNSGVTPKMGEVMHAARRRRDQPLDFEAPRDHARRVAQAVMHEDLSRCRERETQRRAAVVTGAHRDDAAIERGHAMRAPAEFAGTIDESAMQKRLRAAALLTRRIRSRTRPVRSCGSAARQGSRPPPALVGRRARWRRWRSSWLRHGSAMVTRRQVIARVGGRTQALH